MLRAVGPKGTAGLAMLLALSSAATVFAQDNAATRRTFSSGFRFVEMTGEELFANVCQGCHMPDATGATGAGTYPSLVANRNLEASGYAVHLVDQWPARHAGVRRHDDRWPESPPL